MNWDAISAIGQILGGLVVLGTLIYLAIQIRQSNRHAEASSEISFVEGWNRNLEGWIMDETTADAIRAGFKDFDNLPKSKQAIFHIRIGTIVNHWVLAGMLNDKNLLSNEIYDACTDIIVSVLSTPGGKQYWEKAAAATPNGLELLKLIQEESGRLPLITELLPWWAVDNV